MKYKSIYISLIVIVWILNASFHTKILYKYNYLIIYMLRCFTTTIYFSSGKTKDGTYLIDKCSGYQMSKTDKKV